MVICVIFQWYLSWDQQQSTDPLPWTHNMIIQCVQYQNSHKACDTVHNKVTEVQQIHEQIHLRLSETSVKERKDTFI